MSVLLVPFVFVLCAAAVIGGVVFGSAFMAWWTDWRRGRALKRDEVDRVVRSFAGRVTLTPDETLYDGETYEIRNWHGKVLVQEPSEWIKQRKAEMFARARGRNGFIGRS